MTRKNARKSNPDKPQKDYKAYLKFVVVAIILLFIVDYAVFKGERPYIKKIKEEYYARQAAEQEAIESLLPPAVVYPETGGEYFEAPEDETPVLPEALPEEAPEAVPDTMTDPVMEDQSSLMQEEEWHVLDKEPEMAKAETIKPPEPSYAKPKFVGEKAKIAIVIDDVGMNIQQSKAALALPSQVTLAFLPYADDVRALANQARAQGHEMIIHTPMEAISSNVSLGPMALRSGMDFAAFDKEFRKIADSFEGYVGVNNHMGSKLTQDAKAMSYLMDELKKRGLYFLDSKTIGTSIAANMAETYGIPFAVRDVFLDHEETAEFTTNALKKVERIAREQGSAIAIGHPKEITMKALEAWIPTLEAKGFELVSLSKLLSQPKTIMVQSKPPEKLHPEQFNDIAPAADDDLTISDRLLYQ